MRSKTTWVAGFLLIGSLLLQAARGAEGLPGRSVLPVQSMPAVCRDAPSELRRITPADVEAARAELLEAIGRLDRRLTIDGENGEAWRNYLRWAILRETLAGSEDPDLDIVGKAFSRYDAQYEGLRLRWFLDVKEALWRYHLLGSATDNPELPDGYREYLEEVAGLLEDYAKEPTAETAHEIGDAIHWLDGLGQASALTDAIRHHYARANVRLDLSADLIAAAFAESVDETAPVRDVILGADIYGTGRTTGAITARLLPGGTVEAFFHGTNISRTVGHKGPVRIYSNGRTELDARVRIVIGADGFAALPTVSQAETDSTITAIRSKRGSQFVEQLAWRQAARKKGEGERIGSCHAQQRLSRQIDDRIAEVIDRANEAFGDTFRNPLVDRNLYPRQLHVDSTATSLRVVALMANRSQLAAPTAPPELPERFDMALRVHESTVNNLADGFFSGMMFTDERIRRMATELLGETPDALMRNGEQEPWAITFARSRPMSVTFADDKITLTICGRSFQQGDTRHRGMDISAVYELVETREGFKAIRQGKLQAFPPGFKPGEDKLSAQQTATRRMIGRRFGKFLVKEFVFDGFTPPGNLQKVGRMRPVVMTCRDGWLSVAFKVVP